MRLHVHEGRNGQIRTIADASAASTIGDHIQPADGEAVFAVDNEGRELNLDEQLGEAFAAGSARVVTHPGRQITVTVHYAGQSATLTVAPGVRLGEVRTRAIAELGIDPAAAADLSLRLIGDEQDLPLDRPVASIAHGADRVELELVALVRPQG